MLLINSSTTRHQLDTDDLHPPEAGDDARFSAPPRAGGAPAARVFVGAAIGALRATADDLVEDQSDQSFPASDPPSWTGVTI